MTDPIKPATRAEVEDWKKHNPTVFEEAIIATLKSWEPIVMELARIECQIYKCEENSICLPCDARKLMEQYDA